MKSALFGSSSFSSSPLLYGCWRIAGPEHAPSASPEQKKVALAALHAALEAGYSHFDLADIYGGGLCEELFGQFLQESPGLRAKILITSKCGIRFPGSPTPTAPYRYDFSADYIVSSCEGSLRRLQTEYLDVFLLHRPDVLMQPEEVAAAFSKLQAAGKVRHFGVSNFRPSQLSLLQKFLPMPLLTHQVEISLLQLDSFDGGVLDQCQTLSITPTAWSPLARGALAAAQLTHPHRNPDPRLMRLGTVIGEIAQENGVARSVLALAWLLQHPARIFPIVGSTQPQRIREMSCAPEVRLSREDWYRLYEAARGGRLP